MPSRIELRRQSRDPARTQLVSELLDFTALSQNKCFRRVYVSNGQAQLFPCQPGACIGNRQCGANRLNFSINLLCGQCISDEYSEYGEGNSIQRTVS